MANTKDRRKSLGLKIHGATDNRQNRSRLESPLLLLQSLVRVGTMVSSAKRLFLDFFAFVLKLSHLSIRDKRLVGEVVK